jgi:hypothetical protein
MLSVGTKTNLTLKLKNLHKNQCFIAYGTYLWPGTLQHTFSVILLSCVLFFQTRGLRQAGHSAESEELASWKAGGF